MKKLLYLILISLFMVSCSNNELTKEEAKKIIEQYYQLPFQTKIAIDKRYEDYGWPPEKYRQLSNMGLIILKETNTSIFVKTFEISVTENAREYWLQNGVLNQAPEGNQLIIVFKGYLVELKDLSVSSKAKENTAEAEVILGISNISPIQEVFSPLESTEIKQTIYFKLYNDGWKVVEDGNSKKLFNPISAPQHWAGGWQINFDNSPLDFISREEITRMQQEAADLAAKKIRIEELKKISRIPTKTIATFHDVGWEGRPKSGETLITDVGVDVAGSPYDSHNQFWFDAFPEEPKISDSGNTFDVYLRDSHFYKIRFLDKSERDRFYQALIKARKEWRAKFHEILE